LPKEIRRVALLPVAAASDGVSTGAERVSPILQAELRKCGLFEVVAVTRAQVLQWTGQTTWRADEVLPANFLARVRDETGCDAILFPALTTFRAYPPLAVGLDLRLVGCEQRAVLWAVDEVLDAGAAPVARSARDYSHAQVEARGDPELILHSPSRFAQFASATLLRTLPER